VDLLFLERAGNTVEPRLAAALQKDPACTPATVAWVLSQIEVPDGAVLPGHVSAAELRRFIGDLVVRLRRAAADQLPK
jgi:aryl-alcohol dehydrogenase-like predicted oxidoreductase